MHCPHCKNDKLVQMTHHSSGVVLDVCKLCKGLWFDAGELDRVLNVAAKDLRPPSREEQPPSALCPKCHRPMATFHYPQTMATIDMCRECQGIWLDAGEFQEIMTVRQALRRKQRLEEWAPVPGIKGIVLRWIDSAIGRLREPD